jgi:hypothetical protein
MNEENEIQQEEITEAVSNLAKAIQELMDIYAVDRSKDSEDIPEKIVRLSNQVSLLEKKQEQLLHHTESIKQLVNNIVSTNNLLERAGEANLLLGKQHYEEHVVIPMLRSLFPIFDLITDYRRHCNLSGNNANNPIISIYSQLQQFASNYDIEIIEHAAGNNFNPRIMKPVGWKGTSEKQLENCVAESLQIGFRLGETRILRLETVNLYKYEPSEIKVEKNCLRSKKNVNS